MTTKKAPDIIFLNWMAMGKRKNKLTTRGDGGFFRVCPTTIMAYWLRL